MIDHRYTEDLLPLEIDTDQSLITDRKDLILFQRADQGVFSLYRLRCELSS